jgi:ketosteroid isomerase-like protein
MRNKYDSYAALDPFFEVIQKGLGGIVDGEHYFDTIADDAVFEFRYDFPGWPRRIEGRVALMELYSGYGDGIVLSRADALVVHPCRDARVYVLEYDVHGRVVASGAAYENRFVSIVSIENRKIVLWRDYMDSLAAMRALGK